MATKPVSVGTRPNHLRFDGFSPVWLGLGMSSGFPRFQNAGTGRVTRIYVPTPNPYPNPTRMKKITFLPIYYPSCINRNSNPKKTQTLKTISPHVSVRRRHSLEFSIFFLHISHHRSLSITIIFRFFFYWFMLNFFSDYVLFCFVLFLVMCNSVCMHQYFC